MMNSLDSPCTEIRSAFPLYVGGDLDPDEGAAIEQHIDRCPACAISMEPWITMRGHLDREAQEVREGHVPSLWNGVRAQMQREGLLEPATALSGMRRVVGAPRFALVGTLAAAAALLAFGVFFQSSGKGLAGEQGLVPGTPGLSEGTMVLAPLEESTLGARSGLALRKADPADRPLAEGAVEVLHNLRASGRGPDSGSNRLTSGH
jgi:hypothetical protein